MLQIGDELGFELSASQFFGMNAITTGVMSAGEGTDPGDDASTVFV